MKQVIAEYKFLFLLTFVVIMISLLFCGCDLLYSLIASIIFTTIAIVVKYCGDKLFSKMENKWFSKNK